MRPQVLCFSFSGFSMVGLMSGRNYIMDVDSF